MIKSELIEQMVQSHPDIPEHKIADCVNTLFECMSEELSSGGRVEIRGFGSFSLHYRKPRQAHNPKTGAKVITEAKYTPHFKPGKDMRERVDASKSQYPIIEDSDNDNNDDY